jgi:DNA-directed RNA polymerase subunit F
MKVVKETPVTWSEAKAQLSKVSKNKELGYEQKNALEHLKKFCKISADNVEDMMKQLQKIEKLNMKHIVNIINHLPQDLDDLRLIFANERVDLPQEDKQKILDIVKKGM